MFSPPSEVILSRVLAGTDLRRTTRPKLGINQVCVIPHRLVAVFAAPATTQNDFHTTTSSGRSRGRWEFVPGASGQYHAVVIHIDGKVHIADRRLSAERS